jgi:hypothetical protein
MSTQQPPDGGYAQPQDPWEGGFEPGLASVPTDPIPEQRYDAYTPGAGPSDMIWSQQTVAQGGYVPRPESNRTGMIVLIVLIVLVLGGGGGYAAYYFTSKRNPSANPTTDPSSSQGATTDPTSAPATSDFDPYAVKVDDCLRNNNPVPTYPAVDTRPDLQIVPCDTDGALRVTKVVTGGELVKNAQGDVDGEASAKAACPSFKFWYVKEGTDDAQDLVLCIVVDS